MVALGVGIFLTLAFLRILLQIRLSVLLVICYVIVFTIAGFSANEFIPAAFDSGGVTTGPITVPFIMAFGIGLSTLRSDKDSSNDSFGLVALCSIGPILAVLLLGIFYKPEMTNTESVPIVVSNTVEAARAFRFELPHYIKEISIALFPIILIFAVFQLVSHRYRKKKLIKILVGFFLTYVGLILFLTGVNVGFMPAGELLGEQLAEGKTRYLLVPIGMLVGYFIVSAEPAVHVLKTQVEEISNGMISQKAIGNSLSIGVAASVGLSMIRLLTGINIMWLLIPGYAIALVLSFFVPPIYTGVAFDSGGVASGPMTATFLLPFAMGACKTLGGNLMIDAFGTVAMVAMTPLITIQVLGFHAEYKSKLERRLFKRKLDKMDDVIWYFED